jgi:hypothetical protein
MRFEPGNDLTLGNILGNGRALAFPRTLRDKHLYVCGATGTGKSKFLESLVRQDIMNWRYSKCGLMLLDPHGSLYDGVVRWLATHNVDRPVITIDLRDTPFLPSYNPLRQRKANPAVVVDNLIEAMAHVWGQSGTDQTPLFARWGGNSLRALYEKKLTLADTVHLIDDRVGVDPDVADAEQLYSR